MATSGIANAINSRLRISGLSSGIDTESMIQQLMKVEYMKVDKAKQKKTLLEWKRDDYRSITNLLRGFTDAFFDVTKPSTNFRSASAFSSFQIKSSAESIATAAAGSTAQNMSHTLKVSNLAAAAYIQGTNTIIDPVKGTNTISRYDLKNKEISVTLDGETRTIKLSDYLDAPDLEAKLETALTDAFGSGKFDVVTTGNQVEFRTLLPGSTFSVAEATNTFISDLGFSDGAQNFVTGNDISTDYASYAGGTFKIKIGGGTEQTITITDATSAIDLADKINLAISGNSELNGKVSVSADSGKLTFISKTTDTVALSAGETGDILGKMGFGAGASITATASKDFDLSGDEDGKSITVNVNGTDYTVELNQDFTDLASMADYIQTQVRSQSGNANLNIVASGNKLAFSSPTCDKITLKKGPENSLSLLGFTAVDNRSNRLTLSSGLTSVKDYFSISGGLSIPDPDTNVTLVINGTTIDVGKKYADATINDVMSAVNSSSAGVELSYDSLNGRFKLASKTTGAASSITFTDTPGANGLLKSLGIDAANITVGEDAVFELDKVAGMKRSSNTFTVDGVTYTLKDDSQPDTEVTIDVKADVDAVVTNIKNFVAKYNEIIDAINKEYSEERFPDYTPLTDDQKSAMKDKDVEMWEEKAKSGMLKGDSILSGIVTSMRKALYENVTGVNTSLYKIGITTGAYQDRGKLIIDETKLRDAISKDMDGVVQLFAKDSQYSYTDAINDKDKRQARFENSGLAERLYDIIQDNIRTTRDQDGPTGTLLEKAGITGDITEFKNTLTDEIDDQNDAINILLDKLTQKEDSYYAKFAAMESALSKMNSQSQWLTQQLGGGG